MKKYVIQSVKESTKKELAMLADALQEFLYYDVDYDLDTKTLNPNKEIDCSELFDYIHWMMGITGLKPEQGPQEWSPKDPKGPR